MTRMVLTKVIVVIVAAIGAIWLLARSGVLKPAAVGAVLFLVAVDASFNAYSSINSSPWTYENMSGDGTKSSSGSKYVWMANGAALVLGAFSAVIASSLWPLAGSVTVVILMHSLYRHAMNTGKKEGNTGWGSKQQGGGGSAPGALALVPSG